MDGAAWLGIGQRSPLGRVWQEAAVELGELLGSQRDADVAGVGQR